MDYDLDEQDRQWLNAFNHGQERLPYRRMELLLWRLDTANAEATDSAFASKLLLQLPRILLTHTQHCIQLPLYSCFTALHEHMPQLILVGQADHTSLVSRSRV